MWQPSWSALSSSYRAPWCSGYQHNENQHKLVKGDFTPARWQYMFKCRILASLEQFNVRLYAIFFYYYLCLQTGTMRQYTHKTLQKMLPIWPHKNEGLPRPSIKETNSGALFRFIIIFITLRCNSRYHSEQWNVLGFVQPLSCWPLTALTSASLMPHHSFPLQQSPGKVRLPPENKRWRFQS